MPSLAALVGVGAALVDGTAAAVVSATFLAAGFEARLARPHAPRARSGFLSVVGFALGVASTLADGAARERRLDAVLPRDGTPRELRIDGRLTAPVERDFSGERLLVLDALPQGVPQASRLRVRLRVRGNAEAPARSLDDLRPGERVRAWCRLGRGGTERGALDPLRPQGLDASGSVKSPWLVERVAPPRAGRSAATWAGSLAFELRRRLDRLLGHDARARALAGAMLLGEREALAPADLERLRDSGLLHLVSISGLHVAILLGLLSGLARRLRGGVWSRLVIGVAALLLLPPLVGPRPSVLRAALGGVLWLAGRALGREGDALNALVLLAAVLAVVAPASLAGPAYQLTFAATAGILVLAPLLAPRIPLPRPVALSLALSAGAYVATAPIVAAWFGRAAPIALVSNLAAAPLCAATLASGWVALVLAPLGAPAELAAAVCSAAVEILWRVATIAARVPGGAFAVPPPHPLVVLAGGAAALAGLRAASSARAPAVVASARDAPLDAVGAAASPPLRRSGIATGGIAALALVALHLGPAPAPPWRAEVWALDVGQGQAVLLRGAEGGWVLLDAGGTGEPRFDPGTRIVVPWLLGAGCRRLDVLVVTHDDVDHAGGAFAVLRDLEVGELWLGPRAPASPGLASLAALARGRGTAIVLAERGVVGRRGGVDLRVLGPSREEIALPDNERSVALVLGRAPHRVLVPADRGMAGEAALLEAAGPLAAEVLVAGHHGSRGSSSAPFLAAVAPQWALVSAGRRNRFGHPHRDALERLREAGARVRRTDVEGTLALEAGPAGFRVRGSPAGIRTARRSGREPA